MNEGIWADLFNLQFWRLENDLWLIPVGRKISNSCIDPKNTMNEND
jgi:hypothetical protein